MSATDGRGALDGKIVYHHDEFTYISQAATHSWPGESPPDRFPILTRELFRRTG
jgi:hypothetical protein